MQMPATILYMHRTKYGKYNMLVVHAGCLVNSKQIMYIFVRRRGDHSSLNGNQIK